MSTIETRRRVARNHPLWSHALLLLAISAGTPSGLFSEGVRGIPDEIQGKGRPEGNGPEWIALDYLLELDGRVVRRTMQSIRRRELEHCFNLRLPGDDGIAPRALGDGLKIAWENAGLVVLGSVVETRVGQGTGGDLGTLLAIEVREELKGRLGPPDAALGLDPSWMLVQYPGWRVRFRGSEVCSIHSRMPQLIPEVGDEVVLFVPAALGNARHFLAGLPQLILYTERGAFTNLVGTATGAPSGVSPDFDSIAALRAIAESSTIE